MSAWDSCPFPDKYNNHAIAPVFMNPANIAVSNEDRQGAGMKKQSGMNMFGKSLVSEVTGNIITLENADMPLKIQKYIDSTKLGNQIVAKWFNRSADGKLDMSLIQERGYYNATELEAGIAKGQTRGLSSLADAGEELINNTFVVFSKLTFVENEPIADAARIIAKESAKRIQNVLLQSAAMAAADVAYNKAKEGYSVWTKTWLYKLQWNDSISSVFYNDLWNNKEAFDNSDIFKFDYIGQEESKSLVTFSFKEKRTEEQIIKLATVRNIDKVYAKLQKEYDVFKPKVPVLTTNPITAQIGMKEGLEGGEKFEVLEIVLNPETNTTEYKRVGTVTVDKKQIWDNRYNAGEEVASTDGDLPVVDRTFFKGMKDIQPGMLLRQLK